MNIGDSIYIVSSFSSEANIEAKITELEKQDSDKKASGKQKLRDLGLDDDEIKALTGA